MELWVVTSGLTLTHLSTSWNPGDEAFTWCCPGFTVTLNHPARVTSTACPSTVTVAFRGEIAPAIHPGLRLRESATWVDWFARTVAEVDLGV
jgi:hypothetical protein